MFEKVTDYSANRPHAFACLKRKNDGARCSCGADAYNAKPDTVEMTVRPGMRYGSSGPGERVRVDKSEMKIQTVVETLCTPKEYRAITAEAKARADKAKVTSPTAADQVRDSIAAQIEARTKAGAVSRRGDARFIQSAAE